MMTKLQKLFGGQAALAKCLDTEASLVSQWKQRKRIPQSWWKPIVLAAEKKGLRDEEGNKITIERVKEADLEMRDG
jgi:hypothetical protein